MRDYAKVAGTFWTGATGRSLRADRDAQVLALYLMTSPHANMIGLYYLPLPTLCHETGIPLKGALKALRSLSEGGFCTYASPFEGVFIHEMAKYQIGETLSPKDNRHKAVVKEWQKYAKTPLYMMFFEKYGDVFSLPKASPFEAPSKPGAGAEEEEESPPTPPGGEEKDSKPKGRKPNPMDPLFDAVAEVSGLDPSTASKRIATAAAVLYNAKVRYTPEEVHEFGRRYWELCSWAKDKNRTRPSPHEIAEHIGLLRSGPARPSRHDAETDAMRRNANRVLSEANS